MALYQFSGCVELLCTHSPAVTLTNLALRYKCCVPVTKGGALPSKFLLHVTLSEELADKATCPHFMQAPWLSGMGDVGTVKHHRENLAAIKTAKNNQMQARAHIRQTDNCHMFGRRDYGTTSCTCTKTTQSPWR